MSKIYVLDACALIAALTDEQGAEKVRVLFDDAVSGKIKLIIHKLNLLEVYYDMLRRFGKEATVNFLNEIKNTSLFIEPEISDEVFLEAGRLKATYKISLADAVALAEASARSAEIVTSDHHEFNIIEQNEPIRFLWIR